MSQNNNSNGIVENIKSIIQEPVHGKRFYGEGEFEKLLREIENLCSKFEIYETTPQRDIVTILNNYIKQNVEIRRRYFDAFIEHGIKFDENELKYRTAYGALVEKQAMCAGYAEALRVLLAVYGIKSETLLSKLPGSNKRLLHYVVVAKFNEAGKTNYVVLDPERQFNSEVKGYNFKAYQDGMTYIIPREYFTNDPVGTDGVGSEAKEYISYLEKVYDVQHGTKSFVKGTEGVGRLIEEMERERRNGASEYGE